MPSNIEYVRQEWDKHYPNKAPAFFINCPGRVNLIGEHVDHQAYPVLPCAIEASIALVVAVEPKRPDNVLLQVKNVGSDLYPEIVYESAESFKVDRSKKVWNNYVCAAYFGVAEFYANGRKAEEVGCMIESSQGFPTSMLNDIPRESPLNYSIRILMNGTIPACSGLSSSAALVVSMALAFDQAASVVFPNECVPQTPMLMADICAKAERYSGVASGGMDQAAVLLSKKNQGIMIEFKPLKIVDVPLPPGISIVVINTCREAPKAKAAAKMYNKRVLELKLGCLALLGPERAARVSAAELLDLQLRDVVRDHLQVTEEQLTKKLDTLLPQKVWQKDDVLALLGQERLDTLLEKRCGVDVWSQNDDFEVYKRVRHVLCEAQRVHEFQKVTKDPSLQDVEKAVKLGELLNLSGNSLACDFECSTPEIDEVSQLMRESGAFGCRLTGAGWGGCCVALVPSDRKAQIMEKVRDAYFLPLITGQRIIDPPLEMLPKSMESVEDVLFSFLPGNPASVQKCM